jgi:hypothetical protein
MHGKYFRKEHWPVAFATDSGFFLDAGIIK